MSEPLVGALVAHGHLAEAMLEAVEGIAGTRAGLTPINNRDLTPQALRERIAGVVGEGPAVVFVDLPSGSCAHAARRLGLGRSDVVVVCGVNLPLLLDFVFHRELPLDQVVERFHTHTGISIEGGNDADPPGSC